MRTQKSGSGREKRARRMRKIHGRLGKNDKILKDQEDTRKLNWQENCSHIRPAQLQVDQHCWNWSFSPNSFWTCAAKNPYQHLSLSLFIAQMAGIKHPETLVYQILDFTSDCLCRKINVIHTKPKLSLITNVYFIQSSFESSNYIKYKLFVQVASPLC